MHDSPGGSIVKDEKGPGGRPPKPKALKQSKRAMVTFTPTEYRKLLEAAGGKPAGTFIREAVLRSLAKRRK